MISLLYPMGPSLLVLSCMLTRPNCLHLGLRKAILSWLSVQTCRLTFEMVKGLEVGVLLVGSQLSVILCHKIFCANILNFWQPPEDANDKGKVGYINFKRVVWHEAFWHLLESIADHSATGFWVKCADHVNRHLFPVIMMLSADYEEQ
jgi:hypothetical protein